MKTISAYCPAALSFIFKSCPHADISRSGSIGVGCTIDKGVIAEVHQSNTPEIYFNQKLLSFPTVSHAISTLSPVPLAIHFNSPLPLGSGFGLSGACTLAALYASNKLLNLKNTNQKLHEIAHTSEILHKTGLGTVATEITGGFLLKRKAGLPVEALQMPFIGQKVYAIVLGAMDTSEMLKDETTLDRNNISAQKYLNKIQSLIKPSLSECLALSYKYILESGLLPTHLKMIIEQLRKQNIRSTMAIFGQVIFCDKKLVLVSDFQVEELIITNETVRLL